MGARESMHVINDNLKAANNLYEQLAYAVHEFVTDTWSDEAAVASRTRIAALQTQLAEKLSVAAAMAKTLRV
jgi:hypothetical protein